MDSVEIVQVRIDRRVLNLESNMDRRDIPVLAYQAILNAEADRWDRENPDHQIDRSKLTC